MRSYIKIIIYAFLMLWFADCAACGRVDPWWGAFAAAVFFKEAVENLWEVVYGK